MGIEEGTNQMRIAVFSDTHSNLPALEKVISDARINGVDSFASLGDIVGYGPWPNECVDLIRDVCSISILGNHDNVALKREQHEYFNPHARKAIEWTQSILTEQTKEYLGQLPYFVRDEHIYFVHASPKSPADWFYVNSLDDALENFDYFRQTFCCIGHTHYPSIITKPDRDSFSVVEGDYAKILEGKCLVNVGSVGQSRDGNSKASYGIVDLETNEVTLHRVDYNVKQVQSEMKNEKLPSFLIERLSKGR